MRKPYRIDAVIALVGSEVNGALDGSEVNYLAGQTPPSESAIDTKFDELVAQYTAVQYQRDRQEEYPSLQEQMDMQYWDEINGTTTWKDAIAKVKSDNPKG